MDYGTAAERVARGAAWLDGEAPGWRGRVDVATLDMDNPMLCVLGQVFAADGDTLTDNGYSRTARSDDKAWSWPDEHGFIGIADEDTDPDGTADDEALRLAWITEIQGAPVP